MDKAEARVVAKAQLERFRSKPFADLKPLLEKVEAFGVNASSGQAYDIEVHAIWDERPDGNIRIFCEASAGFWSSMFPVCESFVMSPEGRLIGE